jgi:hypothetical protein
LYVNFFQPSLKLVSKKRDGAKVSKKYDKAKTPYQRLLLSSQIGEEIKEKLKQQYRLLDPLELRKRLEKLQDNFWQHAWKDRDGIKSSFIEPQDEKNQIVRGVDIPMITPAIVASKVEPPEGENKPLPSACDIRRYRRTKKPRKPLEKRAWRTRKDPFADCWSNVRLMLELNPERTAKSILDDLRQENCNDDFMSGQLRTLQRRVKDWRVEPLKIRQKDLTQSMIAQDQFSKTYISLIAKVVTNGYDSV